MELYPLDLFSFFSKVLSAKCKPIAELVAFVHAAAVAKLKPKLLTIEPISAEQLEELLSQSKFKFQFVGDLQSCALLSINTLVALSATNKSWLRIRKSKSDLKAEENSPLEKGKFPWRISIPPVKTVDDGDSESYLIQCLCVSNAPRDFVLYVTDVKFFNILNHWSNSESLCDSSDKVQIDCEVESESPSIAKSAVISKVFADDEISGKEFDEILDEYFMGPKLLRPGEVLSVNLLQCGSLLKTKSGLHGLSHVFFKVISLNGQSKKQEHYVLKGFTDLYLNPPVHSYLPPKKFNFVKTEDEIRGFDMSKCPDGLVKYYSRVGKALKLLMRKGNLEGMILLTGAKGSGKKATVKAVSAALGLNFIQINCFDLYGITPSSASMKLNQISMRARLSAPCVLYLENVELLGREQNYDESTRLIDVFETRMKEVEVRKSDFYPLLVIGSTQLKASDVVPAIARLFVHTIPFEVPTSEETYGSLRWLVKYSNMICDPTDLRKATEKIRGYVLADLVLLVQHAIRIRNEGSSLSAESRRVLRLEHFLRGIGKRAGRRASTWLSDVVVVWRISRELFNVPEVMEAAYSDSIGAARVPKVHWEDIGGLSELKEEIMLTLNLAIDHPELFASGLKRSGILFYGPPGTGKTLMAKAVATECTYNFLSVKGPELMNMYVGQSEKNVREVFERAREAAPCVIFFDELDSLAPSRGKTGDSKGVSDRVVSQLLAEMDGLDKNKDVFVIAATNRPDLIDSALLRPGRFDKMFYVGVCKDREAKLGVLKALTRRFNLGSDVHLESVAAALSGQVTGADLYSVCSNAWFAAARRAVGSIESGVEVSLPLKVSSEDFSQAVAQFIPSLTAQDIDYYENLKSS